MKIQDSEQASALIGVSLSALTHHAGFTDPPEVGAEVPNTAAVLERPPSSGRLWTDTSLPPHHAPGPVTLVRLPFHLRIPVSSTLTQGGVPFRPRASGRTGWGAPGPPPPMQGGRTGSTSSVLPAGNREQEPTGAWSFLGGCSHAGLRFQPMWGGNVRPDSSWPSRIPAGSCIRPDSPSWPWGAPAPASRSPVSNQP